MLRLTRNKRLNEAINELLATGWELKRRSSHLVLTCGSERLCLPCTTPDRGTTAANYFATIKRAKRRLINV